MTTWEDQYFIDDLVSHLAQNADRSDDTAQFLVDRFYKQYGHFEVLELKDRTTSDPKELLKRLYPFYGECRDKTYVPSVVMILRPYKRICFGLQATYEIINYIHKGKFLADELEFTNWKKDVGVQVAQISHLASQGSPREFKALKDELTPTADVKRMIDDFEMAAQACTHMAFSWRQADYQAAIDKSLRREGIYPPLPKDFFDYPSKWKVYSYRNLVILIPDESDKSVAYVLLRKDMLRLEMLCRSISRAILYYSTLSFDKIISTAKVLTFISYFIETLTKTNRCNEVCRAWDVVFGVYVAQHCMDIWPRSYDEQSKKYNDNKYAEIVSYDTVLHLISGIPTHVCFDLLKVYKVLPPPDFDPIAGFLDNKVYHDSPWSYGVKHPDHDKNAPDIEVSDEEFHSFQRLQLLRRFYRMSGYCPGFVTNEGQLYAAQNPTSKLGKYPNVSPNKLHIDELKYICFTGVGRWEHKNVSSPDVYSDKSCPPNDKNLKDILDGTEFYNQKIFQRNYLMYYLSATEHRPTYETGLTIPRNMLFHQVTAHFKPESKKPSPRNFYSAKPQARILMSEWEQNVDHYLEKDVAAFISKDPQDRAQAMHNLLGTDYDSSNSRIVYISFDLDKFSPRFSPRGKESSFRVWQDFFSSPIAAEIPHLSKDVDIHYFHHGIHLDYKAQVLDPEGMWGKTNTAYHEDIMAFAVRKLIQMKYLKYAAKLAVFIDDGLLTLKFDKDVSTEHIVKVLNILEYIYYYFGFRISWDKTFVSEHYATFLSEYYYKRSHIDMPFRAFLKMQRTKVINEISPLGQIKSLIAMGRASAQLGVKPHIVMYTLTQEVLSIFSSQLRTLRLKHRINPLEMSLFLLTPTAMGGVGMQIEMEMLQNPTGDALENFFGLAAYISSITSNMAKYFVKITNQTPRQRTNLSILRAPMGIMMEGPHLTDMKHYRLCAPKLVNNCANATLKWIFSQDLHKLADAIVEVIPDSLSYLDLSMAYDESPIAIYDKFLSRVKRGGTVLGLLSWRGKLRIQEAYKNEASRVITSFITLIRHG